MCANLFNIWMWVQLIGIVAFLVPAGAVFVREVKALRAMSGRQRKRSRRKEFLAAQLEMRRKAIGLI